MAERLRLDKWLWHARFFKTRSLAARVIGEGRVRLNGERVEKPAQVVGEGDMLTFPQGRQVRVVEVAALGTRRGPAEEARNLYVDQTPPPVPRAGPRPTGRDRRKLDETRRQDGDEGPA
ncbi:RNA-binding S4 domain-containing protein [Jannaschia aquimarina]|uniref:HslR protein n=1 Tax=Jannaschia aquimarina TaxID=935700 RepID=A0A0D1EER0_9RHOB|nr:RNA-binding S4 domain-containing protein [Jannaschia aquimarina]KIT16174.1 Heat shock protein 15 [Jannaschia aquimarina]SNT36735.1 heat shock protein Hsp15 [Jannaschia aquimarina]